MKTIEECQAQYGRVWVAESKGAEFIFRKPTSREWADYDATRIALAASVQAGTLQKETTIEYLRECEDLCKRVIVSHSAEELQQLEDEYLGIYRDLAQEIASTVDAFRVRSGKESPPPGAT